MDKNIFGAPTLFYDSESRDKKWNVQALEKRCVFLICLMPSLNGKKERELQSATQCVTLRYMDASKHFHS